MAEAELRYVGPLPEDKRKTDRIRSIAARVPVSFLMLVALPTLIAIIYFALIATPRYVSESRFVVRRANQDQPSALGMTLQGVGLASTQSDAFLVHSFINSRDGLSFLRSREDVAALWGPKTADAFSRHPRLWEGRSFESLFGAYRRFVTVGYDSTSGISTLRVEAFTPEDAQKTANILLGGGEQLVNTLNERAAGDALRDARLTTSEARARLVDAQNRLAAFRNRERFIDPKLIAEEGSDLAGRLSVELALLKIRRSQTAIEAPQSPQLPAIDTQIAAIEVQIAQARERLAGSVDSLAPKVGVYEGLVLERELADRALASATQSEDRAREEVRRQRLYLDRVVNPSKPDRPGEPKRLIGILAVLATTLLFYGVGWLIVAGVRETRQV